jgi:hypothetical protein
VRLLVISLHIMPCPCQAAHHIPNIVVRAEAKEVEKMAIDERSVEGGDEAGIRTRRRKRKGEVRHT